MDQQSDEVRYWTHIGSIPPPHFSGKRVYVGHTPQADGMVLDLGYLVCVDTYCFGTGYLTAMNVDTDEMIQVDKKGFRRRVPAEALGIFLSDAFRFIRSLFIKPKPEQETPPEHRSGPTGS